ncbi:hypothetical protein B0H63DRAFT_468206 [Podospora didyma]|uniref:Uncharacterized protein n=1 Tax=Podospora didyma TaxID=330526 RepID=A0AAE0NS42_9PEZI|nr:hypothetical protein B0H63DRAFT_468206 [Podospora didyma]
MPENPPSPLGRTIAEPDMEPNVGQPPAPLPTHRFLSAHAEPTTPNSMVAEFGEVSVAMPSALERAGAVARSYHLSRGGPHPRLASTSKTHERRTRSRSREPPASPLISESLSSSQSGSFVDSSSGIGVTSPANEMRATFLQSTVQQTRSQADNNLAVDIAMGRFGHHLVVAEIAVRKLSSDFQRLQELLTQQKESDSRAQIRQSKERAFHLPHARIGEGQPRASSLSSHDISTWFSNQDAAWSRWARDHGHSDPQRLSTGLHQSQLGELCDGIGDFARLTNAGRIPLAVLNSKEKAVHALLQGMLANFLCAGIIASPFWVFKAVPPVLGQPGKEQMERLHDLLLDDEQDGDHLTATAARAAYHHRERAQIMQYFADGGMSRRDVPTTDANESERILFECRWNYARELADGFLEGPARFLLRDPVPSGIEPPKSALSNLIDEALRFSCQLWSRSPPVRLVGWKDLGGAVFDAESRLMRLCQAHAPLLPSTRTDEAAVAGDTPPRSLRGDRRVIMVVQPAVVDVEIDSSGEIGADDNNGGRSAGSEQDAHVWLKARVMVA